MNAFERKFATKMAGSYLASTPGLVISAHHLGKKILDLSFGQSFEYYDLASVTKIVFTASTMMFAFDEKKYRLQDKVSRWVDWFPQSSPATVHDLLCHSAGLTWWHPFYKKIEQKTSSRSSPESAWREFETILRRQILADFKKSGKIKWPPQTVYSDLDLFVIGLIMEKFSGRSLYENWQNSCERMGLKDTDFHRANKPRHARKLYAPTEDDQKWRARVLVGEVHDQNTWALKGVAPHAGLFAPLADLDRWGLLLRRAMRGERLQNFASPDTVRLFTRRQIPRARGDWALDFMMKGKDNPSVGNLLSSKTVGHLGFTGTSLWYDPKLDLLVNILSNRIHPSVENIEIRTLRPKIHTWIAEELN